MVLAALFLALTAVFTAFFRVQTDFLRISFAFIPLMMAGVILGPKWAFVIGGLGDVIAYFMAPAGPYTPGFTISGALTGLVYGLFLFEGKKIYSSKSLLARLSISSGIVLVFIHLILNTFWLVLLYGANLTWALLIPRLITAGVMLPLQIGIIFALTKALEKPIMRLWGLKKSAMALDKAKKPKESTAETPVK